MNPVAGSAASPMIVWSASHGWVRRDRLPVSTVPSPAASVMVAPSSGCPTDARPAPVTSPAPARLCGQ